MIHAYAAFEAKGVLKPYDYAKPALEPHEVAIKIDYCGICHSDLHLIDNDWLISKYPLVPGHEIIGTVLDKGKFVKTLEKGERVGVGWQSSSCSDCEYCMQGEETLCSGKERTCVDRFGGFADTIVIDSRFVFPIPEPLESQNAAPLLCAGITVYAPLRIYNVLPPMSVAVIGIGGLGHLALQYARAFGCNVTAISSSKEKEAEAKSFGASQFLSIQELGQAANAFDFILSTIHADLDWNGIVSLLRPKGRLCLLGIPPKNLQISARSLISGNRSVCGSGTGSRFLMQEMLQFSARHHIAAKTELVPFSDVNKALDRLRANKARYRIVLKHH